MCWLNYSDGYCHFCFSWYNNINSHYVSQLPPDTLIYSSYQQSCVISFLLFCFSPCYVHITKIKSVVSHLILIFIGDNECWTESGIACWLLLLFIIYSWYYSTTSQFCSLLCFSFLLTMMKFSRSGWSLLDVSKTSVIAISPW